MAPLILLDYKPLVDVIVPVYGVEQYIDRCLYSLQAQTYKNFRVLLVDDDSKDGSSAIAQAYAARIPQFHYHHKPNGGAGSARNYGIERTEGDLVMFVDSDDWIEPDYISSMVEAIGRTNDLAMCDFAGVRPDGSIQWQSRLAHDHARPDPVEHILVSSSEPFAWNKIYRRKDFLETDRFGSTTYDDFSLIPSFVGRARTVAFVNGVKYHYVQRPHSAIHRERNQHGGRINFEIFPAYAELKSRSNLFLDDRWEFYTENALAMHLFIYRVYSMHNLPVTRHRAEVIREFARRLNRVFPGWAATSNVRRWIGEAHRLRYRAMRRVVVQACRSERMELLFALQRLRRVAG